MLYLILLSYLFAGQAREDNTQTLTEKQSCYISNDELKDGENTM